MAHSRFLVSFLVLLVAAGCERQQVRTAAAGSPPESAAASGIRPSEWAEPLSLPGAPNAHRVNGSLFRGAQPDERGFRELEKLGVKTVVSLRSFHSDRDELEGTSLAYEPIEMKTWHPEREDLVRFLKIVSDPSRAPVFVHCQHGADRTGLMSAAYRTVVQGWSKERAIDEMVRGGYGFHPVWTNLIDFVRELDVEGLRKDAGIPAPPPEAK